MEKTQNVKIRVQIANEYTYKEENLRTVLMTTEQIAGYLNTGLEYQNAYIIKTKSEKKEFIVNRVSKTKKDICTYPSGIRVTLDIKEQFEVTLYEEMGFFSIDALNRSVSFFVHFDEDEIVRE